MFLIRTNVEDEGWTTDGLFGPAEAKAQVEALLDSEQIASIEGHHFEWRVYVLDSKSALPKETTKIPRVDFTLALYCGADRVLVANYPVSRDY